MSGDWAVLHLDGDPAPGDPGQVRTLATRLLTGAERAERNTVRLRTISAGDGELRMAGDYAPKFRQALGELPGELAKLSHAYRGCGQALTAYAGSLEQAQGQAAAALRQGRDADGSYHGALRQIQSLLPPERHAAATGLNPSTLDAGTADLDPGLRAEIQAAAARGRAAEADRQRARRLAQDAAHLRGDAETRCARTIRSALAGIKNKEWYEKAWDFVSKPFRSWDDFVALCRTVALIAGTVALFVSGPIGLALLAIALIAGAVILADTLDRYQHGRAGLADVGWDALGLIPGARGVANLRRLGAAAAGLARGVTRGDGKSMFGMLRGRTDKVGGDTAPHGRYGGYRDKEAHPHSVSPHYMPEMPDYFTTRHLDDVADHLNRLDHSPANDAMVGRIRVRLDRGDELTEGERNFMKHELTEKGLMDDGLSYDEAHSIALTTHPLGKNYDPEVIDQHPELFSNWWRHQWGMGTR